MSKAVSRQVIVCVEEVKDGEKEVKGKGIEITLGRSKESISQMNEMLIWE